jgi:Protein of unknown function (DUF3500)
MKAQDTADRMAAAATQFLASLDDGQRATAACDFADEEKRRDWSFLPVPERPGLYLGLLDDTSRKLAHELIVASTSMRGYAKVVSVMAMEHVLRALQPKAARLFDPGRYSIRVFGEPGDAEPWGWQIAGHHVSLNFTVAGGHVSPTPSLLGSQPASFGTLAPLADDEERGFRLVQSLSPEQRELAVISHRPPPDLATRIVPRIGDVERPDPVFAPEPDYVITDAERDLLSYVRHGPKGVRGQSLGKGQLDMLAELVEAFCARMPADVAPAIEPAGLHFAWAGGTAPGARHYFRVQGPRLLIEHDNTQDNGNHIHSVWRDPDGDFGDDILGTHYQQAHGLRM